MIRTFASAPALFALTVLSVGVRSVPAAPLTIHTVNYPLQYFAGRIAGEHAEVVFPAPAAIDPAFWKPTVENVGDYQRSDLILLNGAGYAGWVSKVSLPRSRRVITSRMFADRFIPADAAVTHSHGPDGDHAHAGTAFTTWLDFQQAALQAKAITAALVRERPTLGEVFERNFESLEKDLAALDGRMAGLLEGRPRSPWLASHPVYQYLARRYGLDVQSMHWEPQQVPDDGEWAGFESVLRQHPARIMLWEAKPAPETARRLAKLGVEAVVFDPCANVPARGDWLSVMRQNVANLESRLHAR